MDFCDTASELEAAHRAAALSRVLSSHPGQGPSWIDGKPCCRECGEEIPARRLEAMPDCERCRTCQEEAECEE